MKKKPILFILTGLVSLISYSALSSNRLASANFTRKISDQDKKNLTFFLKDLILNDNFGYTLFGDKPISITGYNGRAFRNLKFDFEQTWKIWENYAKTLPSQNNYLLLREAFPKDKEFTRVTLINKKSFLAKIKEHQKLFEEILGPDITGEKLLAEIANTKAGLFNLLHQDEALYGILLGFGKANALAFKRREEIRFCAGSYDGYSKAPFTIQYPHPSPGFSSIQEEYTFLQTRLTAFSHFQPLNLFQPPFFCALSEDPETKQLQSHYEEIRKNLSQIYSKGDFLELTLAQFNFDSQAFD